MSAQVNVASKAAIKINVNTVAGGGGGGVTAHSALTGLTTGDDHTQYLLSNTAQILSSPTTLSGAPRLFIVVGGSTFTMPATTPSSYLGRPWTITNASNSNVTLNAGTSGYLFNGTDQTATLRKGRQIQVTLLSITGSGTVWGTGSLGPVPVSGGSIGVDDLIAGTNVTLTPSGDNQQVTISATGGSVNSVSGSAPLTSTGTSSVVLSIPAATTAVDGYMTSTQATKLAGVATGATANSSDATLLARANHTGTQAASTITGLTTVATDVIFDAAGDLPVGTGADTSARLAKGTRSQALVVGASTLEWDANHYNGGNFLTATVTGAIAETAPGSSPWGAVTVGTSGVAHLHGIYLPKGVTITTISVVSGSTSAGTPTNQWFALCDSSRTVLRVTANDTTTAWNASTVKTLALTSTFTTTYSGLHYIAVCVTATTVPSFRGVPLGTFTGIAPQSFTSTTGLTTPVAEGTTFTASTGRQSIVLGVVS